ncbi:dihydrolipoyl dehydrogenase family protein [Actinopolymorpha pittospori]|uniref:Dihydrolipoamide dehydrogenase n=1 Tax=Actinopolymorpha pittospori TaxID=648752 RepID=A0A927N024_9ACTN|nr:NAD(P)/FAD-dependent oxidoreductase [Actinopolymorpha pittospori]MBE1609322.1 dihydrolipoamide dehydrogenase [Actinopolymorpha pittospori]
MSEHFDAIVVGLGPGGETVAKRLIAAGKRVAVVEKELIGGECPYWACMPSKALLRPVEARAEASQAAGVDKPRLDWAKVSEWRDFIVRHHDDSAQVESYRASGATVIKGEGRMVGPGRVSVDGDEISGDDVIFGTGSRQGRPEVEGLDDVTVWTNREATSLKEIPERVLIIGGSAVGVEMGTFLRRMGSQVTIVQRGPRLLGREDPELGELVGDNIRADGVDLRLNCQARGARRNGSDSVVELDDGSSVSVDVVLLASGRTLTTDLGFEAAGVKLGHRREVPVDQHCRVGPGLWAVGDITGVALFTHTALYQGRVVADNILGKPHAADYTGIPRVVFGEPEIAAVGLTTEAARHQGIDVATSQIDLRDAISRPWTYETDPHGTLRLIADRQRRTLVGAWAMSPLSGEWIHAAALAIRAQLPIDALLDGIAQFPTYSEAYYEAAATLDL